jgi:hypothetical protein
MHKPSIGLIGLSALCNFMVPYRCGALGFMFMYFHLSCCFIVTLHALIDYSFIVLAMLYDESQWQKYLKVNFYIIFLHYIEVGIAQSVKRRAAGSKAGSVDADIGKAFLFCTESRPIRYTTRCPVQLGTEGGGDDFTGEGTDRG